LEEEREKTAGRGKGKGKGWGGGGGGQKAGQRGCDADGYSTRTDIHSTNGVVIKKKSERLNE